MSLPVHVMCAAAACGACAVVICHMQGLSAEAVTAVATLCIKLELISILTGPALCLAQSGFCMAGLQHLHRPGRCIALQVIIVKQHWCQMLGSSSMMLNDFGSIQVLP